MTERDGGHSSHTPNIEEQIVLATSTFNQGHDISEEFDPNKFKRKLEQVSKNFQKHLKQSEHHKDYVDSSIVEDRNML